MIFKERDERRASGPVEVAGERAERQMAFYLARAFGPGEPDILVLNDVRIPVTEVSGIDGDAAQIDHLVLHPYGLVIVESKSVTTKVRVNAHGEWKRWWEGAWRGIASPVQQAGLQAGALRALLHANRQNLRGRKLFGMLQGGFKHCPIDVIVAFSDSAVVERERGAETHGRVHKADIVADEIKAVIARHRTSANLVNVLLRRDDKESGNYFLLPDEARRVAEFLMSRHTPASPKSEPRPAPVDTAAAPAGPRAAAPRAPAPAPAPAPPAHGAIRCRHCGNTVVRGGEARWGKGAYYTICEGCGRGTDLNDICAGCGARVRIRKDGPKFWRECGVNGAAGCGRRDVVFVNPVA